MISNRQRDGWNSGDTYEEFMGRWSRPVAAKFVPWLNVKPGRHWLDVGTGTGALAAAVCALAEPASVVACDPAEGFVESARQRLDDSRVAFVAAGVGSLPRRTDGYDAIVSGLALNFFPGPLLAIKEQLDLLGQGGVVGAYVWDYARGIEFLRHFWDAAATIEPKAAELDEGRRFPICAPMALESLFASAGAKEVRVAPLSVPTWFSSFADYWRPFLGGTGPAPMLLQALTAEQRLELEERLRHRLPVDDSGRVRLQARAWAVAGRKA